MQQPKGVSLSANNPHLAELLAVAKTSDVRGNVCLLNIVAITRQIADFGKGNRASLV